MANKDICGCALEFQGNILVCVKRCRKHNKPKNLSMQKLNVWDYKISARL